MLSDLGERLYLDANAVIYFAEAHPQFGPKIRDVFAAAEQGRAILVTSELTLAEVLVLPLRIDDENLIARYVEIVSQRRCFEIIPVARSVLMESARLRAKLGLRMPDAIHVATAVASSCSAMISEDRGMRLPQGLRLVRVSELPEPSQGQS